MTRVRSLALGLLVLVASVAATASPPSIEDLMMDMRITPLDPTAAPPLAVTTLDGVVVKLADVRGQIALVYFWATW